MDCSIASSVIGNGPRSRDSIVPAKLCMGERILTLRSLLKKFTASTIVGGIGGGGNCMAVRPKLVEFVDGTADDASSAYTADLYSLVSCCFAMTRGGVRFKYISPLSRGLNTATATTSEGVTSTTTNVNSYLSVATLGETRDSFGFKYATVNDTKIAYDDLTRRNAVYFNALEEHAAEIEIPAYNANISLPTQELTVGLGLNWPISFVSDLVAFQPTVYIKDPLLPTTALAELDTQRSFIARAGADDFNLGLFVAIPPMRQFEIIPDVT
jgi:hypothetical protein